MAINLFCRTCKSSMVIGSKKCKKCGTTVTKKNKRYRVVVSVGGKRKTKVVNTKELAKNIEKALQDADASGEYNIQKKKAPSSLNAFWTKQYLPWIKENKKSWYIDQLNFNNHIDPELGDKQLCFITQFDIEKLVIGLKKKKNKQDKPLSAATIKHQLVLLTRIFNIAEQWGVFKGQNPCKRVKKPKLNNTVTEFLSKNELSSLTNILSTWPDRMQASIVKFAMYTGIRPKEVFKLEWRDINFEKETVLLRDPKGILDQILPLSPPAVEVLKTVPKEYDTPFIFYSVLGKQRKTIRHGWKQIKKVAGIHESFRYYDLRHNYATYLVSSGVSLYIVQALLTHKDAKTTQRYAHLDDDALRKAANLSGVLLTAESEKNKIISITGGHNGQ